jgi:WD40 repeat protein
VACTVLAGRPVAVTGSRDQTVRIWDLTTGNPIGDPLTGPAGPVDAVACAVVEGRSAAVTTGRDKILRMWNLTTRESVGIPLGLARSRSGGPPLHHRRSPRRLGWDVAVIRRPSLNTLD